MLETTVQYNEKRREALQRDIDRFLDSGKMIEVLTQPDRQPLHPLPQYPSYFNLRDK